MGANQLLQWHLAPTTHGSNIPGVKLVLRSLVSSLVAGSFALSAFTWGSIPRCSASPSTTAAHSIHKHSANHNPAIGMGALPGSAECSVHLCCVQVAGPTPGTS